MTGSQRHFEWLLDIIREVEEVDEKGLVSVDIFITQFFQQFDMRTAMLVRKMHISDIDCGIWNPPIFHLKKYGKILHCLKS